MVTIRSEEPFKVSKRLLLLIRTSSITAILQADTLASAVTDGFGMENHFISTALTWCLGFS
jgi:hypothetical protein